MLERQLRIGLGQWIHEGVRVLGVQPFVFQIRRRLLGLVERHPLHLRPLGGALQDIPR